MSDPMKSFSPRMWRCFRIRTVLTACYRVFSTYVEVFPTLRGRYQHCRCFLHVCGGVSFNQSRVCLVKRFSPRMWRCFRIRTVLTACYRVFSTYVEVFPTLRGRYQHCRCFLHVCGGVSFNQSRVCLVKRFSPRMWRCFYERQTTSYSVKVFSMYVEVFLTEPSFASDPMEFSPRMWRCFWVFNIKNTAAQVFSTYVEVFP